MKRWGTNKKKDKKIKEKWEKNKLITKEPDVLYKNRDIKKTIIWRGDYQRNNLIVYITIFYYFLQCNWPERPRPFPGHS